MDYLHNRLTKADKIFDSQNVDDTSNDAIKQIVIKMECMKAREIPLWWDPATLKNYVEKSMIPRGLKIKKLHTAKYPYSFMEEWNATLSDCSIKLMNILVKQEEITLKEIEEEILQVSVSLEPYHNS